MPVFEYTALDKEGKQIRGRAEAKDADQFVHKLREMGYYPLEIKEKGGGTATFTPPESPDQRMREIHRKIFEIRILFEGWPDCEDYAYYQAAQKFEELKAEYEALTSLPSSEDVTIQAVDELFAKCPDVESFRRFRKARKIEQDSIVQRALRGEPEIVNSLTLTILGKGAFSDGPTSPPIMGEVRLMPCPETSLIFFPLGPGDTTGRKLCTSDNMGSITVTGFLKKKLEIMTTTGEYYTVDFGWFGLGMKSGSVQNALRIMEFEKSSANQPA